MRHSRLWERTIHPIKYKIAQIIDKRNENICWADLALWSLGYCGLREVKRDGECREGGEYWDEAWGGCYCGKNRVEDS
jgi:hypothetical protein